MNGVGGRGPAVALEHVHRVLTGRDRPAEVVQAAVPCDPVEPRADVDCAVVGEDRVERRREHLLKDVLRVLGRAEHVAAEREQARLVALDERLECVRIAAPGERDQALIALKPE